MKLTKLSLMALLCVVLTSVSFAGGGVKHNDDKLIKTFIENPKQLPDNAYQNQLRQKAVWQKFVQKNGQWSVIFNESSAMPHRAFGKPVAVGGSDARSTAMNFMSSNLREFNIPANDLQFISVATNSKFHYVNFNQYYKGLEVVFSKVQIKMTPDYRVMQFGLDCFNNINLNTTPTMRFSAAAQIATANIQGVTNVTAAQNLKVLPIPKYRKYDFRLVYEIVVENRDAEGIPGKYYTLVDANNGEILYRTNKVNHIVANTDVNVTGTLYLTNPYDPATVEPLKNMKIVESGTTYYTDDLGYLGLSNAAATTANFSLEGKWVKVRSNNVTPAWSVNLNPGANAINIDGNTNIKQRTTYNSINTVHEYMKTKYPLFTGLDFALPANVDVAGSCNAFYDGTSVNFFAAGGGCNATSLVADVCYHEYGHGINDKFYQSVGASFDNGAMGEGYADVWALGITGSPILGIGFYDSDPNGYVRRYDIDKKVYPQDLMGEVHADGEIIAGAFWDTGINLGNLQQMVDIFKETFYAGITGPDGTEGGLFQDILLETLTIDDNDGDLTNGTPNYCAITSAFAIHGISLSAAAGISHSEVLQANAFTPVAVQATVQGLASGSQVKAYYRIGNSGSWTLFNLANTTGSNYEGTIPGQPNGTIIEYYMGIEDDCGTFLNVIPGGAADLNANIPYYIMVGFDLMLFEDFDTFAGNWTAGLPGDNAVTGNWIIDISIPSYVGNGIVQPELQNTPGGLFCAVTGNASGPTAGAGDNDVDGGLTTLVSPDYDLSSYTNPAFTFYRWYTNDQGATPGTDFWQVSVSGDGINYIPVENINVADHSWRRFAFKVLDYLTPTSTVSIKFIAEDANDGSLIEAALDDLTLWDEKPTGVSEVNSLAVVSVFPNPSNSAVNFNIGLVRDEKVNLQIIDNLGREVYSFTKELPAGNNMFTVDAMKFSEGMYQARVTVTDGTIVKKFSILH